jgi:hypothetical protein
MGVIADTRERELVKCDGCGVFNRRWHRVALSSDGAVVFNVLLCRACESDTVGAVKSVWRALVVPRDDQVMRSFNADVRAIHRSGE